MLDGDRLKEDRHMALLTTTRSTEATCLPLAEADRPVALVVDDDEL